MKEEIFKLLPEPQNMKKEEKTENAEEFFKNCKELRDAIVWTGDGEYFIPIYALNKIDCPIKRKNGKDYWEAFFIFLGFEYSMIPKKKGVKLIIK